MDGVVMGFGVGLSGTQVLCRSAEMSTRESAGPDAEFIHFKTQLTKPSLAGSVAHLALARVYGTEVRVSPRLQLMVNIVL